jgi:photosystem II stability/assembly factor-like uncharacterized protein/TolA-binding protein
MRSIPAVLSALLLVAPALSAAELRYFDDATLRAVQFVDLDEGWAVGDEGVIWHTFDGGRTWERQSTGLRASLRSVHFLNPLFGWVAGREELPQGGSTGVLLYTADGGVNWKRVLGNALPGLNLVRFVDEKTGFIAGDGADQLPGGLFMTTDGGTHWQPIAGPRSPSWLAGDFTSGPGGTLAGVWNRLACLYRDHLGVVDVDPLGGRSVFGLQLQGGGAGIAVGQGGLVLQTSDGGKSWRYADAGLSPEMQASWDFHAVCAVGKDVWAVGRPGSTVLHSRDQGKTWQVELTRSPLPLHGLCFRDDKHGWAVGEMGLVLATTDGGRNWQVQRRGGERTAVLFIHTRPEGVPLDTVALLGGQDGYFAAALRVTAPDFASAAPARSTEALRFAAATRQAGGLTGEMLWQFPVPSTLAGATREELIGSWDQLHGSRAAEQMLRQLVLAVRMWRPDVIVTDNCDIASATVAETLLVEAVHEAFEQAADPKAFPEQINAMGLEPWKPSKLYGRWEGRTVPQVSLDLTVFEKQLGASAREFARPAATLLAEKPVPVPSKRGYRLVASHLTGAEDHQSLMEGITLKDGVARRILPEVADPTPEEQKAQRQTTALQAMIETPPSALTQPERVLSQMGTMLADMPDDQAGRAAYSVAWHFVRQGQWTLAREAFSLLVERYPTHPLAVDAYRWLIQHNASSEARRRHELGQFLVFQKIDSEVQRKSPPSPEEKAKALTDSGAAQRQALQSIPDVNPRVNQSHMVVATTTAKDVPDLVEQTKMHADQAMASKGASRDWYQGALDFDSKLAKFGPLFATDPAVQFPVQSVRRRLGGVESTVNWYRQFAAQQPHGPWRQIAISELWMINRNGPAPRPVATCRFTNTRPLLDGKLDDACWEAVAPFQAKTITGEPVKYLEDRDEKVVPLLQNAIGDTTKDYPTEVRLAHDDEYLYLSVRCFHPDGCAVPPVKGRTHDADLRRFDRISLLLDLDRDYATCFHLQIDQRGCVAEDCWGDKTWNPRWFVAIHSEARGWTAEAAIPLGALTGDPVTPGTTWACNVLRVIPGHGVQAWSLPAEVPEEALRPEGMGLLMFTQDAPQPARPAHPLSVPTSPRSR